MHMTVTLGNFVISLFACVYARLFVTIGNKPKKNEAAVALGRLGGLKGGKARAAKLSAKKRTEIAKKAADARWKKK